MRSLQTLCYILISGVIGVFAASLGGCSNDNSETIKVGILHSLTGTMAMSEKGVVLATRFAIEELNAAGGILGRQIEPVIKDGASDPAIFAHLAESLIRDHEASVIFGCWTSASRRAVKPVVERNNSLLVYPLQYEGMEQSPNILYTGAAPNQQIIPAVTWAMKNLGRRFFLVGSDYIFPHAAHAIIRDQVRSLNGEVAGEAFIPLGSKDVSHAIRGIIASQPDVILNTLNGDTNTAFFRELRRAGITSEMIPTISFSIAEAELQTMGTEDFQGDFAAWNYFQSLEHEQNQGFLRRFQERFGADIAVTDPMISAYIGVHLWAEAVKRAGRFDSESVRTALGGLSMRSPKGPVAVDRFTQHLWKPVYIGRIRPDLEFDIIWQTEKPVRPIPYPTYRSPAAWDAFIEEHFHAWGSAWAAPSGS
jgi:urea transport system substrate-binding protein